MKGSGGTDIGGLPKKWILFVPLNLKYLVKLQSFREIEGRNRQSLLK